MTSSKYLTWKTLTKIIQQQEKKGTKTIWRSNADEEKTRKNSTYRIHNYTPHWFVLYTVRLGSRLLLLKIRSSLFSSSWSFVFYFDQKNTGKYFGSVLWLTSAIDWIVRSSLFAHRSIKFTDLSAMNLSILDVFAFWYRVELLENFRDFDAC